MDTITSMKKFAHPDMPGVSIFARENVQAGQSQEVIVKVEPNEIIPLHKHSVDAHMIIVSGEAEVLFDEKQLSKHDLSMNKKYVSTGDIVYFQENISHGFKASDKGLAFISKNGGIVDMNPDKWDMFDMARA